MNIRRRPSFAKEYGAPVSRGVPAFTVRPRPPRPPSELGGPLWVVKSQIHAGGRGKGKFKELPADAKGGVRLAKSVEPRSRPPTPRRCSATRW